MRRKLIHPRDEIMAAMERIYRFRMTTTSGENLSLRDEEDQVWITPARMDKGALRREDIVCVRSDGKAEGAHPPSSELPFHRAIYAARRDIRAVVHAHPVALVAFSACGQVPDTRLFHHAFGVCGRVGFAAYALPGSEKLGRHIAEAFRRGHDAVVLQNHGVVCGGPDLQAAFERFETLEFTARTFLSARALGEVRVLSEAQLARARRAFTPLPEFDPPPPTARERELRRQLCDFVRRGYRQRLMISTEGSFSVRLDSEAFLITAYQVDRSRIDLDDVVLVRRGRREKGKRPSRASRVHAALYARHAAVGAAVNAYTVHATAFSVAGAALTARTIPESYVVLRDVPTLPFGVQFGDGAEVADRVGPRRPVALLENDGALVTGATILEAFDRLEVLEATAESLVLARALGEVAPMNDRVIRELRAAFFGP
jgi:L-fuculose-phosphate aldolase